MKNRHITQGDNGQIGQREVDGHLLTGLLTQELDVGQPQILRVVTKGLLTGAGPNQKKLNTGVGR